MMNKNDEYQKLTQESHNHFDYNMRIITYTMMLVGGVIGLQSKDNIYALSGVFVILFSSLLFLIGSFRKIFLIHAYISVRLDMGNEPTWHTLIPKVTKKLHLLYETQYVAIIYALVMVVFGVLFYPVNIYLVIFLCIVLLALCLWLFVIPLRLPVYTKTFSDIAHLLGKDIKAQQSPATDGSLSAGSPTFAGVILRVRRLRMSKAIAVILIIFALYELSFRVCTALWGEINTNTRPITLYYSQDLILPGRPLIHLFNWRAGLPLGKIRLTKGTGAYIDGGVFYRKNIDGNWENITYAFEKLILMK